MSEPTPPPEPTPTVQLLGLTRRFPEGGGIESVELSVLEGQRLAIVGPSGSGKSTLLRLIAGLERPDSGEIRLGGEPANDLPPHRRGLSMVFQDQPPYPFLDVAANLGFGLKARGASKPEIRERIGEVAAMLGINDLLARSPSTLSGGERRRVVLGRAIATRPRLLLLDEPFSGLDPPLARTIRSELLDLLDRIGSAVILVSHDQTEAMAFGHQLAVIREGRILQIGPQEEVYNQPSHAFVARFLGEPGANLIRCRIRVESDASRIDGLVPGASWAVPRGSPWLDRLAGRDTPEVDLALRPEQIEVISPDDPASDPIAPTVVARVDRVESKGFEAIVSARFGSHRVCFRMQGNHGPFPVSGDRLPVRLRLSRASWFDPTTGEAIKGTQTAPVEP